MTKNWNGVYGLAAALTLLSGATAARLCNTTTYDWRLLDVRYEGADPAKASGLAIVGVSLAPLPRGSFFECVGQWPESWNGWYEGGKDIIWSDCIDTGAAGTNDRSVAMGLDWKTKTMHLTHSFQCTDKPGADAVAVGSVALNLTCTAPKEGVQSHCTLAGNTNRPSQSVLTVSTAQIAAPASNGSAAATCADGVKAYQSWQVERWSRQYDLQAGSWAGPGSTAPPAGDSGPSFTLRSLAGGRDVFDCKPSGRTNGTWVGACAPATAGNGTAAATTSASFKFDPRLDILTLSQRWNCSRTDSGATAMEAVGVGYVQADCDRSGDRMICFNRLPTWIGTKTP